MKSGEFGVVIMAAGKGTRLKSERPKVLHEIGGQALLLHVIAAAKTVSDEIVCVIGHEAAQVEAAIAPLGVSWTLQLQQLGTGDALKQVASYYRDGNGYRAGTPQHLLVLSGDVPLIRPETLSELTQVHLREHAAMTILTAIPDNPFGYGRVNRREPGAAEVTAIVEQKDLPPGEAGSPEINSGIYCFETAALFAQLNKLSNHNAAGEYYLTDVAALLVAAGERVVATTAPSVDEVLGANTIAEMMHLDAAMRMDAARRLMAYGVTIFRPETSVIDAQVVVGADTILEPYVQLLGATRIGRRCRVRSYSVLQDVALGDDVLVRNGCILQEATVGDGAQLGPYAHLRPGSEIGAAAHVGNFVETKKTRLGAGSKANHLSYLGDAVIGDQVNIGAGVITCNYDGVHKHTTEIENGAFVGSDSTLVAPVVIGREAYVAAGSCITEDVPAESLALGRSRQVTKEGWVTAQRGAQELPSK